MLNLFTLLHTHMNLKDISYLIHRVEYDVSPSFTAITAPNLLGRQSTWFGSVFMEIFLAADVAAGLWKHTVLKLI